MMQQTLLACSLAVILVSGQRYPKSIPAQPKYSYSTTIMHSGLNAKNPESESSFSVNQPQYFHRTSNNRVPNSGNLFNVGYDLRFKEDNDNNHNTANMYKKEYKRYTHVNTNKKFENAQVITGRLKKNEKVRAPNINSDLSPRDFVSNALLKQQLLTSVRQAAPVREQIPQYPSQSSTFTYNTQQNIFKDVIKATKPETIQLNPELKSSYNIFNNNQESRKKVEPIVMQDYSGYYSKAPGVKYTNPKATNFDHNVAIKNSEAFDFSNAHGEITFDNSKNEDASVASSEQYSQKQILPEENNSNGADGRYSSDLSNLNIQAHLPRHLQGVKTLPVDTSLLKDVVLTTNFQQQPQPSKHARVIPIHFDVRQIQEAMQKEFGAHKYNQAYTPQQNNYAQSATGEGSTYEDHRTSPSETTSYRMYGKAVPVDKKEYNVGFSYGKENANYEEDIYKIVSMRPPPVGQNLRFLS